MTMPREAITVPPGTPGAPTAKIPSSTQKRIMLLTDGSVPYSIRLMAMQKKTSVRTEPQRRMLAKNDTWQPSSGIIIDGKQLNGKRRTGLR